MSSRRMLALAAAFSLASAIPLAVPMTAHAGSYEVAACDAAGGVNNSWVATSNNPQLAAYGECPSSGNPGRGLVARNAIGASGATVPRGAVGQFAFFAPEGTVIVNLRASYRFYRNDGHWEAALSTGTQLLKGCGAGGFPCEVASADENIPVPGSPTIYIDAFCALGGCPVESSGDAGHGYLQATANLYSARVTLEDDSAPGLGGARGGLWSDGWKQGRQSIGFDASDNSGIRQTRVLIDGQAVAAASKDCDASRPVPCPQGGSDFAVETSGIKGDGPHTVSVEATDAAGNPARSDRQVLLDNTAPVAPQQLTVEGGEGWRAANAFNVSWQNPTQDAAPIAGAVWELCPEGSTKCESGRKDGRDLSRLDGLKVPRAGDYVLRLWLRDEASNEDRRSAAPPVHLRFDDETPDAAFEPPSANDPTRVAVHVDDHVSGLGGGTIEIKRRTGTAWNPVQARVVGDGLVGAVDDERLPNGIYDLRAHVVDQAGNERSTTQRADGSPAELKLPLRLHTRLTAGAVRASHGRRVFRAQVPVGFARRVRLGGRLTGPDRKALVHTEILVMQRLHTQGAPWELLTKRYTSRTGRFSFLAPKGVSRTIRFRYAGTATVRAANGDVSLRVHARTTFHSNRREAVNGETIQFTGRLRGGRIPAGGKLVELQVLLRGSYRTFATTQADQLGRWSYDYRFDGTRGRQVYSFRARVPHEATYPFETGHSGRAKVIVRGL